jgi:hypothetical protein
VTVTNAGATVGQYGSASIIRTGSDAWTVIPFAGGAALLSDSAISGTTGSPTTATYTDGGINYKTYAFTGSGSITLSKGGLVDCLVVAGGGGGKTNWGGGGGGSLIRNQIFLPAATHTITVGAGGSYTSNLGIGAISAIGLGTNTYLNSAIGGGSATGTAGNYGACGSGGNGAGFQGLAINSNLGYDGGTSTSTNHAGGGGGIGGAAPNIGTANVGGAGGIGLNNSFRTGSNIGYGGGGGGGGLTTGGASGGFGGGTGGNTSTSATAGTANTGGGGGGAWAGGAAVSANGGSGLVVVRVKA